MVGLALAKYYYVIGYVPNTLYSLQHFFNGFLKDFGCRVNSKTQSLITKQANVSGKGGNASGFFGQFKLVIALVLVYLAENSGSIQINDQVFDSGYRMSLTLYSLISRPHVDTNVYSCLLWGYDNWRNPRGWTLSSLYDVKFL